MKAYREAFLLIKNNRWTFIGLNIVYFSIVVLGMFLVRSKPDLQKELLALVSQAFGSGPMQYVTGAYTNGQIINAIAFTFIINVFLGSFIAINLPSMIIPFSGFLMGGLRAMVWGFLFSPDLSDLTPLKILAGMGIALLILFEGEGYVLALFAAYLHGRAWLIPASVEAHTMRDGYMIGLQRTIRTYLLVISMLLIAAIYEVILAILILPALIH